MGKYINATAHNYKLSVVKICSYCIWCNITCNCGNLVMQIAHEGSAAWVSELRLLRFKTNLLHLSLENALKCLQGFP